MPVIVYVLKSFTNKGLNDCSGWGVGEPALNLYDILFMLTKMLFLT